MTKQFRKAWLVVALVLGAAVVAQADEPDKLFVSVTSEDRQTQGFSMILATRAMEQGQEPRILLCGPGAEMALRDYDAEPLEPAGANPQQMMQNLINEGVTVEVCAIFLPNTEHTEDDLIDGVAVASVEDIAAYMADPEVRYFSN
ncbi:MAG: DsrE family protein [Alkalispirochaeta sp.]